MRTWAAVVVALLGLFSSAMTTAQGATPSDYTKPYQPDSDTVALYHFDGSANDAVLQHDGVLFGTPAYSGGKSGQAIVFDGQGDYARMGNIYVNPTWPTSQGTVESWFRLDEAPGYFSLVNLCQEYGGGFDAGFYIGRLPLYSNNLAFGIWSFSPWDWHWADSGIRPEALLSEWHHVAGTWGPRGVEIWLDGQLVGSNSWTNGLPVLGDPSYDYTTMLVGSNSWRWDSSAALDELRVSAIQRTFVPEPATLSLLALGSLLIGRRRRA